MHNALGKAGVKPMRPLLLSNLYLPHEIGSYEQWCQEVAVRLRAEAHLHGIAKRDARP
jgi:hypothetical protein